MSFEPLKLKATTHDQVDILSTLLQDSIFHMSMCSLHIDEDGSIKLLFNRFCWECYDEDDLGHYRTHSIVHIYNAKTIHMNNKDDHHDDHEYMNLLGMHTTKDNHIVLLFSGNKQIKIGITDILVLLEDVDKPWITYYAPRHDILSSTT